MTRIPCTIVTVLLLAAFLSGLRVARADSVVRTPAPGSFVMRPELAGVHPRLYFTAADIPEIRSQALGPRSFFVDKAREAFGGYVGRPVDVTEDWKHYLFGFWGQFAMAMLYIVEEDPAYADTAVAWALHYARTSDWLADDLVPMDITSGMALTYDILYDRLTEDERAELRAALYRSIDFMQDAFYIDEYWTNDFQNNHMHNRIHGVAHAALAILGDDPALDAQPHADLAYACFEDMTAWLSDDGSTHAGPGFRTVPNSYDICRHLLSSLVNFL
jgi:hypothetical protein